MFKKISAAIILAILVALCVAPFVVNAQEESYYVYVTVGEGNRFAETGLFSKCDFSPYKDFAGREMKDARVAVFDANGNGYVDVKDVIHCTHDIYYKGTEEGDLGYSYCEDTCNRFWGRTPKDWFCAEINGHSAGLCEEVPCDSAVTLGCGKSYTTSYIAGNHFFINGKLYPIPAVTPPPATWTVEQKYQYYFQIYFTYLVEVMSK